MVFRQKTRKNTSKMIDKGIIEVYNININQIKLEKRGTPCLLEKSGNVSMP